MLNVDGEFDLVYIDPPYVNSNGVGVDYFEFYHFLEGLANYGTWAGRIDRGRKHRPLMGPTSLWSSPKTIHDAFSKLFRRFSDSVLVVSYRSDGLPSCSNLVSLLEDVKAHVDVVHYGEYKYVLSNGESSQMLRSLLNNADDLPIHIMLRFSDAFLREGNTISSISTS